MEGSREYLICETRAGDKEGVNEMDRQHWVASVQSVHQRDRMRTSRVSRGVQMEAEHIDRALEIKVAHHRGLASIALCVYLLGKDAGPSWALARRNAYSSEVAAA